MSTAVLISGQMRTFAKCYPTQRWQIFRHYEPDIHFFVSCVDDEQAKSAELLREHYANVHIERIKDPQLPEIPIEAGRHAPYANAASHKKLLLQHWNQKRVWQFFQDNVRGYDRAIEIGTHQPVRVFDTIIRIRPDLWIHRFEPPAVNPHYPIIEELVVSPWWGKFGGINDRLAVMGKGAAATYFGMFTDIQSMLEKGCPFHPETLLAETLRRRNVRISNTLMASFSTIRMDGSQRWPEVIMDDIAELIATVGGEESRQSQPLKSVAGGYSIGVLMPPTA